MTGLNALGNEAGTTEYRILVVDDDSLMRNALRRVLRREDVVHELAASGEDAIHILSKHASDYFSVAIIDLLMPGLDGQSVLLRLKQHSPNTQAIILTGCGTIQEAVRSTRNGADDFLEKPFDIGDLRSRIWSACQIWAHRVGRIRPAEHSANSDSSFVAGTSASMRLLMKDAERIASNHATVLIRGETGTGKSMLAREIHRMSSRRALPFVAIDLTSIGGPLMESELFGHTRGSFTGAQDERVGLIRSAGGGTVFLDEIGELTPPMQAKLLHVLQERQVRPMGSDVRHPVHARFIAATNRNLDVAVADGGFRGDLYHRLNVMELTIPPLRDRRDDIPLLVRHLVARHQAATGLCRAVDDATMRLIEAHDWPGNVRELDNVILRGMLLASGETIVDSDLPAQVRFALDRRSTEAPPRRANSPEVPRPGTLAACERDAILAAMSAAEGNRRRAAEILDIGVATLYRKLKRYGLS